MGEFGTLQFIVTSDFTHKLNNVLHFIEFVKGKSLKNGISFDPRYLNSEHEKQVIIDT